MRQSPSVLACLLALSACAAPAHSQQLGIVVGIDRYNPKTARLPPLRGAANDAKLLQTTLRRIGVDLPASRVLVNEDASVSRFQAAWNEVLAQAKPGDRIIVTFAGHGSQEKDQEPIDEKDGLDETLLFYDYDHDKPKAGRISDDTLHEMFKKASAYSILFVSDSCHAGGMTRGTAAAALLPARSGPDDIYQEQVDSDSRPKIIGVSDSSQVLEHVTYLNATDKDELKIHEIFAPGPAKEAHGALSVAFAEAIGGQADADGNQTISRRELADYIQKRVPVLSDRQQMPSLLPRSGDEAALSLAADTSATPSPQPVLDAPLPVKVEGGKLPPGLSSVKPSQDAYRLRFAIAQGQAKVYNAGGDWVAELPAKDAGAWNRLIDKYRLLDVLDADTRLAKNAVAITLANGGKMHRIGEELAFGFDPQSSNKHMILFDLAGNGETQLLYPRKDLHDPLAVAQTPHRRLLQVAEPVGEDDLVAVFCDKPNAEAVALLESHDGKNPPPAQTLLQAIGTACQVGRYGFFSTR